MRAAIGVEACLEAKMKLAEKLETISNILGANLSCL
jgi:hypothetical protein